MNTHVRTLFAAATLMLPLGSGVAPLAAQTSESVRAESAEWRRLPAGQWDRDLRSQREIEDALRAYGFRADRLSRTQTRALEDTYSRLFPDQNARIYRLNRSQATALVYMALVHERGLGGRFPRSACQSVTDLVYDLDEALPAYGRNQARYLDRYEQERLLAGAREIQQEARRCDQGTISNEARTLVQIAGQRRVERENVIRQIQRLRQTVRTASRY